MYFNLTKAIQQETDIDPSISSFSQWWGSKIEPQREAILEDAASLRRWIANNESTNMSASIGLLDLYQRLDDELEASMKSGDLIECLRLIDEIDRIQ